MRQNKPAGRGMAVWDSEKLVKQREKIRKRGSRIGIRWKVFSYLMLFLVILLVILWCFQVVFFGNIYKRIKTGEIMRAADIMTSACDLAPVQLSMLAERIAQDYDVCILMYEVDGAAFSRMTSKHYRSDCVVHRMDEQNIAWLYYYAKRSGGEKMTVFPLNDLRYSENSSGTYTGRVVVDNSGEGIIYTRVGRPEGRQTDILLILNTTISPVGSTIKTLRTQLIIVSVIMTAIALLLSFLLARKVSRPIIRINSGAKLLAEGNYDVRFGVGGYREIAELSDTLSVAAEELSKTGALQRELIANISHDLRTPLTMIGGYAEMMRDIPGENTPENMQIIIDETKRLTSLVNDILDISKLQSGTQTLSLSDFNLTETIREVIGRFSKLTEQDGWTIDFTASEEVIVNADRTRILQVVYNFINNAITHSGGEKLVEVRQIVREQNGSKIVRIEVTDHGEGIPEENLKYIWDRYYKVDKTHRRAVTGSGLGLSIVKSILEMHHARYGVESEVGKGSTFWFEL